MKILIVTPAGPGSRKGNRITAVRWGRIFRALGHRVQIALSYANQPADLLVALHAGKSADSVRRFRERHPHSPLVLALTGTDLYGDIHTSAAAKHSLEVADRLVVLQPLALEELPKALHFRAKVIYQSVRPLTKPVSRRKDSFDVCILGHLRPVKDPFRTALAARLLSPESRIRVLHLGGALSEEMATAAQQEQRSNPRYHWLGERPRRQALRCLARCRLLSLTSLTEGGANAVSEAVTVGVPVVSSRIAGSIGLLGEDYPGYFPVGDTEALAALLLRAERDGEFLADLTQRCHALCPIFSPEEERRRWSALLGELSPG